MGIFIGTINKGGNSAHNAGPSNPDDGRPKPIGGPKSTGNKAEASPHHGWTPHTMRDFSSDLEAGKKGYRYSKAAAGVTEIIEREAGANHVLSPLEARKVADEIGAGRVALGLNKNEADNLGNMIKAGPPSHP